MSLKDPHLKMSKSHQDTRSRICVNDGFQLISHKIRLALTDSVMGVSYDPINRPGVSNLLTIMAYLDDRARTPEELAQSYRTMSMREFKDEVSKSISDGLASIREKYNSLMSSNKGSFLDDIAIEGSIKAQKDAAETMAAVRQVVGLERSRNCKQHTRALVEG